MRLSVFGRLPAIPDWDPSLKPALRRIYNLGPTETGNTSESINRPDRQQEAESACNPPHSSRTLMPPPPPPVQREELNIKTPRPDATVGFLHDIVADRLTEFGLGPLDATEFVEDLQFTKQLLSCPTQSALDLRFPALVLEGKSYVTGKTLYEAQNQAAVSGSCMLNLQHQLADLTQRVAPGPHQTKDPLAFSICTEGPIMELWVHYTTVMEGVRRYNMCLVESCHASRRKTVREFFVALDGAMKWAGTELLNDVALQVSALWRAAQPQTE